MFFPVAGIEVHPLVPPLAAFVVSFFTSMGGVSGAFLLLPFQMSFLGYTAPSVSGTNQLFNIVAIPSGVWRYMREGRMVWPLTWVVVAGTLPGVLLGAVVRVAYLPDPASFKLFAGLVLLYIGAKMALDLLGLAAKRTCPGGGRGDGRGCAPGGAGPHGGSGRGAHEGRAQQTLSGGEIGDLRQAGEGLSGAGKSSGEAASSASFGVHGSVSETTHADPGRAHVVAGGHGSQGSHGGEDGHGGLENARSVGGRPAEAQARPTAQTASDQKATADSAGDMPKVTVLKCSMWRISYEFRGEVYDFSTPGIFALSLIVGVVGGVYGIGGGSIVAPFFVSVFGLPVYTVAGAALMGTFVTSVAGVAFYQAIAPFYPNMSVAPDWGLGILFGIGGMAGMYLGARCQKHVPAKLIKWMLCAIIVGTALKYVVGS